VIVAVSRPRRCATAAPAYLKEDKTQGRIPERGFEAGTLRPESKGTTDGSEAQKPNPSPAANDADQPTQKRHGIRPDENDRVKRDVDERHVGPVMRKRESAWRWE
jgi:hypothetical protein